MPKRLPIWRRVLDRLDGSGILGKGPLKSCCYHLMSRIYGDDEKLLDKNGTTHSRQTSETEK